jgi:amino acid transporter
MAIFMIQPSAVNQRANETERAGAAPLLRRELGRWDLTAIGINQVIGGAVFAMPAALAALVGGWSPILIVCVGFASLLIAATFAEVGSRFDATGGPYLYTRAAFGRFAAFEVGWMQWFTRVASWASVINVLVASLGFYWPAVTTGAARTALMTAIITVLAIIIDAAPTMATIHGLQAPTLAAYSDGCANTAPPMT